MLVIRGHINNNIKFTDYCGKGFTTYTYDHFSRLVDAYKNLFQKHGAVKGQSVVIGNRANTSQTALFFACAELGLTVTIVGNPFPANKTAKNYTKGHIDNKLKLMLPVDFFIVDDEHQTDKYVIFNDVCDQTINISKETLDYTPNHKIDADINSVLIKCTSSGTTDTPKVILHTHAFLSELISRNSRQFYGIMGMMTNLAHGSSPAVYFIPGLFSDKVTQYINLPNIPVTTLAQVITENNIQLDHLLVPYTMLIDEFFNSQYTLPNCIIHTLGIIRNTWVQKQKAGIVKDIISIFGTNETSGPLFINQASDIDFNEETYKIVDDFYQIQIIKNNLLVKMPVYDKIVKTEDLFAHNHGKYRHMGRSNLFRINDLEIDINKYTTEINKSFKGQLVIDTKKDDIYLAIWDKDVGISKVDQISTMMQDDSKGLHRVGKYAYLNYSDFLSGIKLDMEMLREYFRNL